MIITVLSDNQAEEGFFSEHGLSFLLEMEGEKLLFDTGGSRVFLDNAEQLGISVQQEIKTVVLSHGHWDHGNGLSFLSGQHVLVHPGAFMKRYRKRDHSYIGLAMDRVSIEHQFRLTVSQEPYYLSDTCVFLGEIPRINDFEAKTTDFIDENQQPDFVMDDSAMAIVENNELIVVTGCSHSGICNIIDYAVSVTGIKKVRSVIGGFHLKKDDEQTRRVISCFKEKKIQHCAPCHCTEKEAKDAFRREMAILEVKAGMKIYV